MASGFPKVDAHTLPHISGLEESPIRIAGSTVPLAGHGFYGSDRGRDGCDRGRTIKNAALILVLASGRIVEQGTHDGLLARGGLYAELCASSRDRDRGWAL